MTNEYIKLKMTSELFRMCFQKLCQNRYLVHQNDDNSIFLMKITYAQNRSFYDKSRLVFVKKKHVSRTNRFILLSPGL